MLHMERVPAGPSKWRFAVGDSLVKLGRICFPGYALTNPKVFQLNH